MKWHIGCSGFHYKEWKDHFYPEGLAQKKWFSFYASVFNTLELNNTFYRFPQLTTLKNWHTTAPPAFVFSVKAPRLITHFKQFVDCTELLTSFYETLSEGLQDKLGPVLFQLPPSFQYSDERLERIIASLHPSFQNVLEFRHETWWQKSVYDALRQAGISFSGISHPTLPGTAVINSPLVYYRFHGVPKLYYSVYAQQDLQTIADTIRHSGTAKEVYVYFNNTAGLGAIDNARWLIGYLA